MRKTILGALASTAAASMVLIAPMAVADSPAAQVAGHFGPKQHVVADPAAVPALKNANQLNDQINRTGEPIYVASVAPSATGVVTPLSLEQAIVSKIGHFSGLIVVQDSQGYKQQAWNVPAAIANQAAPLLDKAAANHKGDPYGILSDYVTQLFRLTHPAATPPAAAPQGAPHKTSYTWLWIVLGIIAAIALIAVAIMVFSARKKKAEARRAREDAIDQEIIKQRANVDRLAEDVVGDHPEVSGDSQRATLALADAKKSRKAGNLTEAEAYLGNVRSAVASANIKLTPKAPPAPARSSAVLTPPEPAFATVPEEDRKRGSIKTTNPDTGRQVTINNYNYRTQQSPGYSNYYAGGMYNGMYFYPGYYPYAFWGAGWGWNPVDVLIMDELLMDRWNGSYPASVYEGGYSNSGSDVYTDTSSSFTDTNWSSTADTQETDTSYDGTETASDSGSDTSYDGGSSDSGSDTSYDGGSDSSWDNSPAYADSGSSSSYDSGSSSSSSWGSSSDSGSSSSWDSGSSSSGGGWDSGSSSSFDSGSSGGGGCGGGSW